MPRVILVAIKQVQQFLASEQDHQAEQGHRRDAKQQIPSNLAPESRDVALFEGQDSPRQEDIAQPND